MQIEAFPLGGHGVKKGIVVPKCCASYLISKYIFLILVSTRYGDDFLEEMNRT